MSPGPKSVGGESTFVLFFLGGGGGVVSLPSVVFVVVLKFYKASYAFSAQSDPSEPDTLTSLVSD